MRFGSDNWAGASDKVMQALLAANTDLVPAYGSDPITARLERRMCELFEREVAILLVATGTAANSLATTGFCPPHGAIVGHVTAHLNTDECGAPEFFGSNKLISLPGARAKIDPLALERLLAKPPRGVHHVLPSVLTLTQATELGTIYTVDEVKILSELAKSKGLTVHMDGARLANAIATLKCSPADITWKAGVDVLSFGATKGGCLIAEAIVLFDPSHAERFGFLRKRSGQLVSKHRALSAQFDAWLDGGHWLELAAHANAMATRLAAGIGRSNSARINWQPQANELFVYMTDPVVERLRAAGGQFYEWDIDGMADRDRPGSGETLYRFVTSFRTTPDEVDHFLSVLG
jgi:threonine aldolase